MKTKKVLKIILICIAVIALIFGGIFTARTILKNQKSDNTTYTVTKETYENVIEISGTIAAAQEQTLQALSAGTVMGVYVSAGQKVKKGDVLITLDDTTEQYNLAKHDYDMATKRITGSQKEIALMETQRLSLLQKIADRKVVATFDGVIAAFDVAVGDSLEAKDKVGTIVNIDYLTAEVEIAETDVSKLKIGQKVIFSFPAYKQDTVEGYVTGWPAIGEVTSRGATIVKARVRIDDYPPEILPNYSFTGKIEISPTEEYLIVSRYAIGYEDKEPYVVDARTGEKKAVTIKPYGKDYVKVLSGIKEGAVLKQLTVPKLSGYNKKNGMPSGVGMPGGMGGMGAPGGMPSGGPRK